MCDQVSGEGNHGSAGCRVKILNSAGFANGGQKMKNVSKSCAEWLLSAILFLSAVLCGCDSASPTLYTATYIDVFDTVLRLQIVARSRHDAEEVAKETHERLLDLHHQFDIYHDPTDKNNLKTINDHAGDGKLIPVSEDILRLLELGQLVYEISDRQVNICMGAVLSLWHTAREDGALPDETALRSAASHTSFDILVVDTDRQAVRLADPEASLDVGAIAKGYAVAQAADILRGRVESGELTGVLMDFGGQILALGVRPDGTSWAVGIRDPRPDDGVFNNSQNNGCLATCEVRNMNVVTSGVDQRFIKVGGTVYHHLIDPQTLYPGDKYLSVTVLIPDYAVCRIGSETVEATAIADALSTALFLLPEQDGKELLAHVPGSSALWVMTDGQIVRSDNWGTVSEKTWS